MPHLSRAILASLLLLAGDALAGGAPAADRFRIESETQFLRDYGHQVERVAPGVYLVVHGAMAGKTVAIGEAGLAYDLAVLRTQTPRGVRERAQWQAQVRRLEDTRTRITQAATGTGARAGLLKSTSGALPCQYLPLGGFPVNYFGSATVSATAELYLDRGDGTLNPYYARAGASASGLVIPPYNVPTNLSVMAYATAHEKQRGTRITKYIGGTRDASVSTGYVYSGPAFFHDLFASANVTGQGYCYGYVSISDSMTPGF